MRPSYLQPALLGGAVLGVLSALPIIRVGNCCCLWQIAAGVIAAYLLQQNTLPPITVGDGAIVGLIAGAIGSVIRVLIAIPLHAFAAPFQSAALARVLSNANLPPDVKEHVGALLAGGGGVALLAVGFILSLVIALIFSALGGMLGATMFRKATPPPTVPPVVPSPPMGPPPPPIPPPVPPTA